MTTATHVDLSSLVWAEFRRARQTLGTVALVTTFTAIAVLLLVIHLVLNRDDTSQLGVEVVTLNSDVVGFGVLLAAALAVAKDHGTGANDLLRLLAPSRAPQLLARAAGIGVLALAAVGVVMVAGAGALLALHPAALLDFAVVDGIVRTAATTVLLAAAGVGIGALTRSSAAASLTVIAVYWLLPIALIIAGLAGHEWANSLTEATLAMVAANAISPGAEHWVAVGGVALWAGALAVLGALRERTVR